jgi:hypothetical protein
MDLFVWKILNICDNKVISLNTDLTGLAKMMTFTSFILIQNLKLIQLLLNLKHLHDKRYWGSTAWSMKTL